MEVISQPGVNSALVMWTQQGGVPAFSSYCPSDRQMLGQTPDRQTERADRRQTGVKGSRCNGFGVSGLLRRSGDGEGGAVGSKAAL